MSHRRQSFCFVLSAPLLLSTGPDHAHETVRRRPPSIITNGAALANPSPREQVSRPAVGLSVRGHRQRAQGRRKDLPATTCQRSARASYTEFVRNFSREGSTPIQRGSNASLLGRVQAVKLIRHNALRHLRAVPRPVGRLLSAPGQSGAGKLYLPRYGLFVPDRPSTQS